MFNKNIINRGKNVYRGRLTPKTRLLLVSTVVVFIVVALFVKLVFSSNPEDSEKAENIQENSMMKETTGLTDTQSPYSPFKDTPDYNSADERSDGTLPVEKKAENSKDEVKQNQPTEVIHVVKPGETFSSIAKKYFGDGNKYYKLLKANPKLNPRKLRPGMKLLVPLSDKIAKKNPKTSENKKSNKTSSNKIVPWRDASDETKNVPTKNKKPNEKPKTFPWLQESPEVPDDTNSGRVEEYVVCEESVHIASAGDTPFSLALKYYDDIAQAKKIEDANPGIMWTQLGGGERICIPKLTRYRIITPKPEKDFTKLFPSGESKPESTPEFKKEENTEKKDNFREYTVKSGDTLSGIAKKCLGKSSRYREIMKLNNISNPSKLRVGMRIKIPGR